jgi:hypothetical protein
VLEVDVRPSGPSEYMLGSFAELGRVAERERMEGRCLGSKHAREAHSETGVKGYHT